MRAQDLNILTFDLDELADRVHKLARLWDEDSKPVWA
jgi:hypothetical protein